MKRFLVLFCLFFAAIVWADIDTFEGTATSTLDTYEGSTTVDIIEGQTLSSAAASAGTVTFSSTGSIAHVEANTDIATTAPSNSSGDLLIACVSDDADQAVTDWDGFTEITSQSISSHRLSAAYIVADGTTSYTFVSGSSEKTAVIFRLTKDSGTWTIEDYDSAGVAGNTSVTVPVITASQDGSLLLVFYGNDDPQYHTSGPADMTEVVDSWDSYSSADPVLSGFREAVDTGDTGSKSITASGTSDITTIAIIIEAQ